MLLSGHNIKKEYGIQKVLDIKKVEITNNDRIGLVGRNGAGKSTLLGILSGRIPCDDGVIKRNSEIALIMQNGQTDGNSDSVYISQLGIKNSAIMSGGEKTRLAIAAAFSKHAPILFADEPTTNLDGKGIMLLEKMMIGYHGAIVLISHDRQLLDNVCNQIWELEDGEIRVFQGNYSAWFEQRNREREFKTFEYEQYRFEKGRLEKRIGEVKQEAKKMAKPPRNMSSSEWLLYKNVAATRQGHVQKRASAMISRLEHLQVKERPKELPNISMKSGDCQKIKAKIAAKIEDLSVSYEDKRILNQASMSIVTGKRTFLTGHNGSGKTTLIKKLVQKEECTFVTEDAKIGYFSQEQDDLDYSKSVIENVMSTAVIPEHTCRAVLMNLYMDENDIYKKIEVLSGGEKVKTAIAKLLVSDCNFLILDEPTNHMDIYTMEGFEKLLVTYDKTFLIVSHDRKMTEKLADVTYVIEQGRIVQC